jgi:hypothetical protein
MRRTLPFAMVLVVLGAANAVPAEQTTADKKAHAPYVHAVIFRMKKDAPKDAVEKAIRDCHEMLAKVPSVRSVRAGRPATKGTPDVPKMEYDFGLLVLVDDADGLKEYLEHPLHLQFVKKHGPYFDLEKLQVFDFMNQSK